jgi:hypothetical protein
MEEAPSARYLFTFIQPRISTSRNIISFTFFGFKLPGVFIHGIVPEHVTARHEILKHVELQISVEP